MNYRQETAGDSFYWRALYITSVIRIKVRWNVRTTLYKQGGWVAARVCVRVIAHKHSIKHIMCIIGNAHQRLLEQAREVFFLFEHIYCTKTKRRISIHTATMSQIDRWFSADFGRFNSPWVKKNLPITLPNVGRLSKYQRTQQWLSNKSYKTIKIQPHLKRVAELHWNAFNCVDKYSSQGFVSTCCRCVEQ